MKPQNLLLIFAGGAIVAALVVGIMHRSQPEKPQLNYDTLAVSDGLSAEAQALNLDKDLNVALLPEIGKQVVQEGAKKGLKDQAFLQYMVGETSNRVREISTIDLNQDGTADPILVKPEPVKGEQYVILSIQVPEPKAYPLPPATDQAAWKNVETLEVATMTVALNAQELTVEAQPNQHMYPNSHQNHYVAHDRSAEFLHMYMTLRMMEWMFMPRFYGFYGPGFGYGFYRPMPVAMVATQRQAVTSHITPATGSTSPAITGKNGQAPQSQYSRAYAKTPPKSLSALKSSRSFQQRQDATAGSRSGGFGRNTSSGTRSQQVSPSQSRSRGGFSSGGSRTRSGGFGRRR